MNFTSRIVTNELDKILAGIIKTADIVVSTMGGAGKNVIIANNQDEIIFTKDGVSVAKSIRFADPEENVGAQLLINAAKNTVKEHGDGTTLTSLFIKTFATELFRELREKPETDINQLIADCKQEIENVKNIIQEEASHIDNNNDIYRVAYTSSKSPRLANFIAEIYGKTGKNANIAIEKSRTSNNTYYNIMQGLGFESGFIHSGFVNQDNGTCYFERPFIIISNENVQSPDDYEELIGESFQNNIPVVFIAPTFSDAFIRFCLSNKQRKGLEICLIKTPGYAEGAKENIKDIKAFLNSDGTCSSIKVNPYEFIIFNEPEAEKINKRVAILKAHADEAVDDYDEKEYLRRISALSQTSAIIYVGGITEKNIKEEYDRLEDAVGAVKSAIRTGFVKGAGITLLKGYIVEPQNAAQKILGDVCMASFNQILKNARIDPKNIKHDIPYNIRSHKYDDTLIDPVGVLCSSLDNSFALIELLINASFLVYNE